MDDIGRKCPILRVLGGEGFRAGIEKGVEILQRGGIVAFPTESYYGLAAGISHDTAVDRLFRIKKRQGDQPILILLPTIESLERYAIRIPEVGYRLINQFWPGGLTLVLESDPGVPPALTSGTGKIGVRLSSHPAATALAQGLGEPITGTSANLSGMPPCRHAEQVHESLGEAVDLILDGGETRGGGGSTILDVTTDPPEILREGMINRHELEPYLSCRARPVSRPY